MCGLPTAENKIYSGPQIFRVGMNNIMQTMSHFWNSGMLSSCAQISVLPLLNQANQTPGMGREEGLNEWIKRQRLIIICLHGP